MTDIEIDAGTLIASEETRTATGLLVPFNEVGRTNLGRLTILPDSFEIPADLTGVVANVGHDREQPVGALIAAAPTPAGIVGTVSFARTPQGDEALAKVIDKSRRHLSVEVTAMRIKNGIATAGRLFGIALTDKPAFQSAALMAEEAPDIEDEQPAAEPTETVEKTTEERTDENGVTQKYTTTRTTRVEGEKTTITEVTVIEEPEAPATDQQEESVGNATVPGPLQATAPGTSTKGDEPKGMSLNALFASLAEAHRTQDKTLLAQIAEEGEKAATLYAALSDIKATGTGGIVPTISQPQWLGELWSGRDYQRRYIPLFNHADLTSFSVEGFRWKTPPVVGPWTGNKTAVPSAGIEFEPYTNDALGLAGAHDIDRRLRDFTVPGFWESYFKKMTDSYSEQSDVGSLATVLAEATAVERGTVPAGVDAGMVSIVDGALAVLDYGLPTFAIVAKDIWRSILLTPKDKILEYLSQSLSLEEGQVANFKIVPSRGTDIPAGKALVGIGSAVTVRELPGSPVRVEGLDMVKGGIDPGLFGYYLADVEEAGAVALVSPAA